MRGTGLTFVSDSGFISKKDGLSFLLSASLTDTTDSYWGERIDADTIGKYYKVNQTGNYFVFLTDLTSNYHFVTNLLLEVTADGTILQKERFYHGNHGCCWDSYDEAFYKAGDFFALKTCLSGSGYCGGHIYLFRDIKPQASQHSIPAHYFTSLGDIAQELSSAFEFHKDFLVVHYTLKRGKMSKDAFKAKNTDRFDVKFILSNDVWVATDSTKLNELDL